jgi:hypothetical protein
LVPEVDDLSTVGDPGEEVGREARQTRHRLADDDELALYR